MNFKNVYATLLCVVAIGLTSCSSELNNDETNALNPNENAAREVTVSASKGATTRSIINLMVKHNGKREMPFLLTTLLTLKGSINSMQELKECILNLMDLLNVR